MQKMVDAGKLTQVKGSFKLGEKLKAEKKKAPKKAAAAAKPKAEGEKKVRAAAAACHTCRSCDTYPSPPFPL